MPNEALRRQLPHGLADLFFEQAAAKMQLEQTLEETFSRWGYGRIILPTFEYYDCLATGASPSMQEEMYRLFDRDGHILALRPDMTVPTARVVGTRLYDQPLPMRFYYVGNVFRYEEPQAGRRREFTQAGIELLGADTPEADAEVLSVAISAFKALGVTRFQVTLGQVAFLKAILSPTSLANGELAPLEQAIGRKNDVEIARALAALGIEGDMAAAVKAVPHLCGDEAILQEALRLSSNAVAREAIVRLQRVYDLLRVEGVADHIILDLGEVRSMAYYTGITFQGYVEGLGFSMCRGGRYDNLLANFGCDLPSVGFAMGVERAMLVTRYKVDLAPDLLMPACDHAACHDLARRARSLGLRVEIDVLGRQGDALLAYARLRGAHRTVCRHKGASFTLIESGSQRQVGREALWEEMSSWKC